MRTKTASTIGLLPALALGVLLAGCSDSERSTVESSPGDQATDPAPVQPAHGLTPTTLPPSALRELRALYDEKLSRTPAQQKIGSEILLESKRRRGDRLFDLVPQLRRSDAVSATGTVLVDIRATVSDALLARIEELGGVVESSVPRFDAIRAELPLDELETLAAEPAVRKIRRATEYTTNKDNTSQGDVAHQAALARTLRSIDGTGVIVGVISDGASTVAARQASGDLPPGNAVQILPGLGGTGDEGTAMMEIIYDLAPGAQLRFATGVGSQAVMALNILNLQAAGANVIVDDLSYFGEGAFQDDVIAQAVQFVTNAGVLYFSSAGNSGNLNDGESGVWEGNYAPTTMRPAFVAGYPDIHLFGAANNNLITVDPPRFITLQWSDPLNASGNDYDLFVFNAPLTNILGASIDNQNGNDDPFEDIDSNIGNDTGRRIVVARSPGAAAARFIHVNTHRGRLATGTFGQITGHSAAPNAFSVAAVNVATAGGGAFPGGAANPIETFSSDGPRRVFYEEDGTPITPGQLVSPGGAVRQKPDVAAADGVATATPGFNPFFGTSAAAPHAAAIAALVLHARPNVKSMGNANATTFVRSLFQTTSLDIEAMGIDRDSGSGIVMADRATVPCAGPSNGMPCNDGNACTSNDTCQGGMCVGSNPVVCTPLDSCHDPGTCNPSTGMCSTPAKADGSACSDGNACTQTDTCQSGACSGSNPVACMASDQCHDPGTCNPSNGQCSNPAKANGTACNDGSACTQSDSCQSGTCTGSNPIVCTASDQCHDPGTCNPANGQCSSPAKPDGATCSDGSACTQSDSCQSGTCTGSPVVCMASDQCHDPGVCNPANGQCSSPAKPDGATCSDGSACTQSDSCQSGTCTGANPVTCPTPDQCHDPGTCNPANGQCSNPAKPDGATCSDGSACTQSDSCQSGTCTGASPVTCPTPDQCHDPGTCNPANGQCSNPAKPNGSTCSDGNACTEADSCQSGTCTGASPVTCPTPDQCHDPGTCNPANGQCSNPSKPNGSTCSDGNACTQADACQSGTCTGANPVTCPTPDQCHDPGTCNPSNGQCSNPSKPNGSVCSDNNACTVGDSCQGGGCAAGAPRDCGDGNVCTDDACNASSGCTHANNTVACSDGNACTGSDVCSGGSCVSGSPVSCNDSNVCTDDSCVAATGCVYTPNTGTCSDGDVCNGSESCSAGTCLPGPVTPVDDGNPCTVDSCTIAEGITHTPLPAGTPCADADLCDGTEVCNASATCIGGTPPALDDQNPCTLDACVPATGVSHTPIAAGTACLDGTVCNGAEACTANGVCAPGTPLMVDDENPCTSDLCDPVTGVSHAPRAAGSSCADGNACNGGETCDGRGQCGNGTPVVCLPLDACHVGGTCNGSTGTCSNPQAPNGTACPGGTCDAGRCVPDGTGGAGGEGTGGSSATGGSSSGASGTGTGGTGGQAGESATGGSSGTAGSAAGGETGEAGDGGDPPKKKSRSASSQTSGCGCMVPGRSGPSGAPLVAALTAALLALGRRRTGARRARPRAAA
jgi:hypothetical protein